MTEVDGKSKCSENRFKGTIISNLEAFKNPSKPDKTPCAHDVLKRW